MSENPFHLKLNNQSIEQIKEFNFLGVLIHENLSWDSHVKKVTNKILRTIGIISRIKHIVPNSVLKIIYSSLILSYLNYGILVWGFKTESLFILQKKAVRLISNAFYLEHTEKLFKRLKILKIEDIFKMQCLKFYYKYKNENLPNSIKNILSNFEPSHEYSLRSISNSDQNNQLSVVNTNTVIAKECIRHYIPVFFNNLDEELKNIVINANSINILNSQLKKYFIDQYLDEECILSDCYPCSMKFFHKNFFTGPLKLLHIFSYFNKFDLKLINAKDFFHKNCFFRSL